MAGGLQHQQAPHLHLASMDGALLISSPQCKLEHTCYQLLAMMVSASEARLP